MYDKKIFKETFAELRASEDTIREVLKMTRTRKIHFKALRIIPIAAVIVLLLSATAFAYGGEIVGALKEFMFGNSSAVQVDEIENAVLKFRIVNRSVADPTKMYGLDRFDTIEEANRFAGFTIKAPSYLPENVIGLYHVWVQGNEAGTPGNEVFIQYNVETPGGTANFHIGQYFAGADAYIELETIEPIQKVMVGDIEASLVYTEDSTPGVQYHLYWMKNDILYQFLVPVGCFDFETALAIAESI